METRQNVNLESMSSEQLALLLSDQHRQAFQVNQNILAIEQIVRNRIAQKKIEGPPETPTEKTNAPTS
jgi:hypothetical protein